MTKEPLVLDYEAPRPTPSALAFLTERRPWIGILLLPIYLWGTLPLFMGAIYILHTGQWRDLEGSILLVLAVLVGARITFLLWGVTAGYASMLARSAGHTPPPPTLAAKMTFAASLVTIVTGMWTLWLHNNNAPVRMWWHPWYDLGPALQLFLASVAVLLMLLIYRMLPVRNANSNGLSSAN